VKTPDAAIEIGRKACTSDPIYSETWHAQYFDGVWDVRFSPRGNDDGRPLFEVHVTAANGRTDQCVTQVVVE
jgi:hypothetical protein